MPVQLTTQFCRASVIFDATGYTDEKNTPVVERQCREMFRPTEYWYLPESELSPTESGAAERFEDMLEERINRHRLDDTATKINLFFYLRLADTPPEKTEALRRFIRHVTRNLLVPTADLHFFIIASKHKQNSEQALENFNAMAESFVGVQEMYSPQLILMDALPLARIDGSVRATVRVANILSRSGALCDMLLAKTASRNLWNWSMSEFNEDEFSQVKEELERIRQNLNDNGPFPSGELQNNLRQVQNREAEKNIGGCVLNPEHFPIPAAAIKKGFFFCGKAADEAAGRFAAAVRETYRLNLARRCFPDYSQKETAEVCRTMTNNIPVSRWPMIREELLASLPGPCGRRPDPRISLRAASSVKAMREQLSNQLRLMNKEVRDFYPQYMTGFIAAHIDEYLAGDEARAAERDLRDRAAELQARINLNNGIKEGTEYLSDVFRINRRLLALNYSACFEQNQYVLISDRVNGQWQRKYAAYLPPQLNADTDVYNYRDLQEYEFQTLTLLTFRREELETGRRMMFRLEGQV